MASGLPRKVVGELVTLLGTPDVTERLPSEKRESGNIDGDITASRIGRKVIQQPSPRILEARFVDFVVHRPGILGGDAGIAIGLLRGAGKGVLTEVFCRSLRVHLDAGYCTRARTATQHELMAGIEAMVQP